MNEPQVIETEEYIHSCQYCDNLEPECWFTGPEPVKKYQVMCRCGARGPHKKTPKSDLNRILDKLPELRESGVTKLTCGDIVVEFGEAGETAPDHCPDCEWKGFGGGSAVPKASPEEIDAEIAKVTGAGQDEHLPTSQQNVKMCELCEASVVISASPLESPVLCEECLEKTTPARDGFIPKDMEVVEDPTLSQYQAFIINDKMTQDSDKLTDISETDTPITDDELSQDDDSPATKEEPMNYDLTHVD